MEFEDQTEDPGPSANPVGDWLKALSSEGDLQGEGGFSLAQEKAWEKLGAFQLPFEAAWALKLVQAAVAGQAECIKVVQTRSETSFQFPKVEKWSWHELRRLLFEVDSDSGSSLGHLAVALRALAKSTSHPFFVNFPQDCKVVWDGEEFQTGESDAPEFEIKISHFVSQGVFKAIRFMTTLQKALVDYCHLCPIALTIDTRRINSLAGDPFCRPYSECIPLAYLVAESSSDLPGLVLPKTDWQSRESEGPRAAFVVDPKFDNKTEAFVERGRPVGAGLVVCGFRRSLHLEDRYFRPYIKPSQLVWLCDGVVVARQSLGINRTVGVLAIISAQDLETDLTGFELRQTAAFKERRKIGLKALKRGLGRLRREGSVKTKGRPSVKNLLGWGGIVLGTLLPPAGLLILGHRWSKITSEYATLAKGFDKELLGVENGLKAAMGCTDHHHEI